MKHKHARALKPLLTSTFLCFGLLIMTFSCQKDDSSIVSEEQKSESNSRLQIKQGLEVSQKAIAFINYRTNNSSFVAMNKNRIVLSETDIHSRETVMGTVKTDKEIVVINETNTKHTFNVKTIDQNENNIINLIIVETIDGIYEYFLKYTFEGKIPFTDKGYLNLSEFSGTIESFDNNGNQTGTLTILDGQIVDFAGRTDPCANEDGLWEGWDDYNDDNENGGTSGNGSSTEYEDTTSGNDNNSGNTSNNTSGSTGSGGCDIYYVDSDGERWELDEWSPDEGAESCCMYLVINCPQNEVIAEMVREDDDPCEVGMIGVIAEDVDDCLKLKEDITDLPVIKTRLHTIKVESENAEKGLRVDIDEGVYTPTEILDDNNGEAHINIKVNPFTVVVVHSHPPSENGYFAMFSGPDIIKMGENAKHVVNGVLQTVPRLDITHIVIADGRTFALRFDDAASVQTLIDIYDNKEKKNEFEEKLKSDFRSDTSGPPLHESTTTVEKQQAHIYNLLSKYNLNMSMYEANYSANGFINDWQKINKETLEKEPCN